MTLHKPVLLKETIELLNIKKGDIVVDATLGGGGHSREILKRIGDKGKLVVIDLDISAVNRFIAEIPITKPQAPNKFQISNPKIQKVGNVFLINDNFANLEHILADLKIKKVDAVLADLGWSSDQISDPAYGLSFMQGGELNMRYDSHQKLTAKEIVNEYPEAQLEKIIRQFGEERFSRAIAKKIIRDRKNKKIETTTELAEIIKSAVSDKYKHAKIHPATRTFQALRIVVNQELESLEKFIPQAIEALKVGGRLVIITFHSLEDRIAKNILRQNAGGCICPPDFPKCVCGKVPRVKIITKKPITPAKKDIEDNPRSRSAKLRVAERA